MAIANKVIHNPATGQTIRFHKTSRETDGALLEMESIFNPFSKEPPPHYHPFQKEHFIVLEGRIHMRVNGAVTELIKGAEIEIPANAIHSMWNPFTKKAKLAWKVEPAMNTEYLLETGMGLAANGRVGKKGTPAFLQSILLLKYYRNVYRLAKPSYFIQRLLVIVLSPLAWLVGYKAVYKQYLD
jgi:mannose-6-phosphate isomerase-like protein (cupin superfamily)